MRWGSRPRALGAPSAKPLVGSGTRRGNTGSNPVGDSARHTGGMGFLDQYTDRGPTVGEVFQARNRLRDEMLGDWERAAKPDRTVFTGKSHAESLRAVLAGAAPGCGCVVSPLSNAFAGVFVLDEETRDVAGIPAESIGSLAAAVAVGEGPVAAVVRIARGVG